MNYFRGILSILHASLAQCGYFVGKREILDIVDEGMNGKTRLFLGY